MSASALLATALPSLRHWILICALLVSVVVIADNVDRFDSESVIDKRVTEEIYEDNLDWRVPAATPEDEWRAALKEEEQRRNERVRFGYDSAYEQMRTERDDVFRTRQDEIGGARATGQIRFSW